MLYVVSTPIGNLDDITLRALHTLKAVDLVAAEDTRRTHQLLAHFDLHATLTSYHDFNKEVKAPLIVSRILEGQSVALVSDAGTPLISDPGYVLVNRCIEAGIRVIPIPGPSVLTAALAASGLPTHVFHFEGFLPRRPGRLARRLEELESHPGTVVLFESPHRVMKTLMAIRAGWGNRRVVIARELTKIHEEFLRGSLDDVLAVLKLRVLRGEVTLLVEGKESHTSRR